MEQPNAGTTLGRIRAGLYWIMGLILILWVVELINLFLGYRLNGLGIFPRRLTGLPGIVLSPFLHQSVRHLIVNTVPLAILGSLVLLRGLRTFVRVSVIVVLLGGGATWLLGRPAYHVGASGLIFGYFGFLLALAWYERSPGSIIIAVASLMLYGGLIWGILPTRGHISWEGHLFGFLAGMAAAWLLSRVEYKTGGIGSTPTDVPVPDAIDPHLQVLERMERLKGELDELSPEQNEHPR